MAKPALTKRSCGTCKDRKILCDRITPTCSQCTRGKRVCQGYDLRLSWPRDNDRRRAIVLKSFQHDLKSRNYRMGRSAMVRASHWDIEMYMFLNSYVSHAPWLHAPVTWNPHGLDGKEWDLLRYFRFEASRSLTTFGSDPQLLANLLMRISQSGNTLASTAVLHSLLGLTSLYRYGWNEHAMELKISSLRALAKAAETYNESVEGPHHVAAGMLLCSFEVHMASCSASEWTWYVNGIKEVLYSDRPHAKCTLGEEKNALLNWVYYHDVMKKFSIRHWRTTPREKHEPSITQPQLHDGSKRKQISEDDFLVCQRVTPEAPWISVILRLMTELCNTVPTKPCLRTMNAEERNEFATRIRILDWRIRNVPMPAAAEKISSSVRLYQLAMLIYLNRVTENILNQASKIQTHIDDAFTLAAEIETCKPHFPMYIVGWEARTDEQRATVLELLERTKKDPSSRSMFHVEVLVQAGWTQDDLAEGELNYWDKVTTLISVCSTMPSFV